MNPMFIQSIEIVWGKGFLAESKICQEVATRTEVAQQQQRSCGELQELKAQNDCLHEGDERLKTRILKLESQQRLRVTNL